MNKNPKKGEYVEAILRSKNTIFPTRDISLLWNEENETTVTNRLKQYVHFGKLIRIRRGLYAKDTKYNRLELATRINTPAYISFETVLTQSGTNFQYYKNIFVASYVNREIIIDNQKYTFIKIKDYVLRNTLGVEHADGIAMATKERAFLDRLYINKDYYLDNPHNINWAHIFEIVKIYNNKRLEKQVERLFKELQNK